jgi:hypothetical protein
MLGSLILFPIMLLCIKMRHLALGILHMLKCLKIKLLLHQMNLMFHLRLLMPDEGQLVVVPPVAATTAADVLPKAKGGALSAGGEMSALAAVRDEAGAVSRRLEEMKEALSQVH